MRSNIQISYAFVFLCKMLVCYPNDRKHENSNFVKGDHPSGLHVRCAFMPKIIFAAHVFATTKKLRLFQHNYVNNKKKSRNRPTHNIHNESHTIRSWCCSSQWSEFNTHIILHLVAAIHLRCFSQSFFFLFFRFFFVTLRVLKGLAVT